MSLNNNPNSVQNRLKLKARRFNPNENGNHFKAVAFTTNSDNNIKTNSRPSKKRFRSEDNEASQNKRFRQWEGNAAASAPSQPKSSYSKNLANKRLQTLRENLKSSLKNSTTSNKRVNQESVSNSKNVGNSQDSINLTPSKNLAENRLKKLRLSIGNSSSTTKSGTNNLQTEKSSQSNVNSDAKDKDCQMSCTEKPFSNCVNSNSSKESVAEISQANMNYVNSWMTQRQEISENITKTTSEAVPAKEDSVLVNFNESAANLGDLSKEVEEMDCDIEGSEAKSDWIDKRIENTKSKEKLKNLCVVIDTNVLMSNLPVVEKILSKNFRCVHQPIVLIPWIVMTELDYIKDKTPNDKLKKSTTTAIRFINIELEMENPRLKGQSVIEASKQETIGSSPDDKIIACCLQVLETYEDMILLSNDVNLKSKAMINNISTCSANDALLKIVTKIRKNTKSQRILNKMGVLCSQVITICAQQEFGEIASKMELLKNGPWPMKDCLQRFQRYWATVFRDKVNKQFTKAVEVLSNLLAKCQYIPDDSEDFTILMKQCITMCIFLKDINECRELIQRTLNELIKISEVE